jgi:hypothetical protein
MACSSVQKSVQHVRAVFYAMPGGTLSAPMQREREDRSE